MLFSSQISENAELPFEARDSDGDSEIRGPQDFYSQRRPTTSGEPEYGNDYGPRNNGDPNSDPNSDPYNGGYDPNQPPPPEDGQQYPEGEGGPPPTVSGPGPEQGGDNLMTVEISFIVNAQKTLK